MEIMKNRNYRLLDYDEMNNSEESKCVDNDLCRNTFGEQVKKEVQEDEESIFASDEDKKKTTRLAPHYHSTRPMPCSCGIDFRLLDLGHHYFPRYLHTGVCKSEICRGLYRCVERHYKVRVLKQRDPRSPEIKTTMTLPDTLKGMWQPELVTVTVACECSL
ncbi:hypothetical protein MTP99_015501 [Tenebrio molitor]|nr:hypothetical protein MTP99_015501 [Tenebrio molitor]